MNAQEKITILGVIPARKGSKRIPAKNKILLCGKPLVLHTVDTAIESGVFDQLCVSTDDEDIAEMARDRKIDVVWRPPEFAKDSALVSEAVIHAMSEYDKKGQKCSAAAVMTPTAPLRTVDDIHGAINHFITTGAEFVSTVVEYDHSPFHAQRIQNDLLIPAFTSQDIFMKDPRTLEKLYRTLAVLRIGRWESILKHGTTFGPDSVAYVIKPEHGIDIDTPIDLKLAEIIMSERMSAN